MNILMFYHYVVKIRILGISGISTAGTGNSHSKINLKRSLEESYQVQNKETLERVIKLHLKSLCQHFKEIFISTFHIVY